MNRGRVSGTRLKGMGTREPMLECPKTGKKYKFWDNYLHHTKTFVPVWEARDHSLDGI